ncbi:unnamed protein product [Mytilus coruscus]|uniref:B box-type domain-containing protein n=1 Tax=Mytilus coruscus TaxID=42192 RepID=A0A6J8B8H9_MYTCO|nr:unnamed protein product [Mytilus coruscus]
MSELLISDDCKQQSYISSNTTEVDVDYYSKEYTDILKQSQVCNQHMENYENFCINHEKPSCKQCVLEHHNKCGESVIPIEKACQNCKRSMTIQEVHGLICNMFKGIELIRDDRKDYLSSIHEQTVKIMTQIHEARQNVDEYLDKDQKRSTEKINDTLQVNDEMNMMSKIDRTLQNLERDMKDSVLISTAIKVIKKSRVEGLEDVKELKIRIDLETKKIRTTFKTHLDTIQQLLTEELDNIKKDAFTNEEALNAVLLEIERKMEMYKFIICRVEKESTDQDAFLVIKTIEEEVIKANESVQAINLDKTSISCKIDPKIENMIPSSSSFGCLNIKMKESAVCLPSRKLNQAQTIISVPVVNIANVTLLLKKTINTRGKCIEGCCLFDDGKIAFSDIEQSHLIVIKKGSGYYTVPISPPPNGIAVIDTITVAVSAEGTPPHVISIVNIKTKAIVEKITIGYPVDGIIFNTEFLFYTARENGIQKYNLAKKEKVAGLNCNTQRYAKLDMLGNKLYFNDASDHAVTCFDISKGKTYWQFRDTKVLKRPLSIATDKYGNVFVADFIQHEVILLSADGKVHKVLMSSEDGLFHPKTLFCSKTDNYLLVANKQENAFLYKLKYS